MAEIPCTASFDFVDAYGITATTLLNIEVDNTKTLTQIDTDLASLAADLAALSQGVLTRVTFREVIDVGADPTTAVGDVEKGALFNFGNASDSYATGIWVPDVNPSILNGSGLVDLANADVTTFITAMTTAATAITVVTKGVRALTGLIDALISFRKRRKPLERKTKEIA